MIVEHSAYYFYFNDPATTEIYTLSLHDALPISVSRSRPEPALLAAARPGRRRLFIICGYLTGCLSERSGPERTRHSSSRDEPVRARSSGAEDCRWPACPSVLGSSPRWIRMEVRIPLRWIFAPHG